MGETNEREFLEQSMEAQGERLYEERTQPAPRLLSLDEVREFFNDVRASTCAGLLDPARRLADSYLAAIAAITALPVRYYETQEDAAWALATLHTDEVKALEAERAAEAWRTLAALAQQLQENE
jgi:hypothetical protein